jgi:adenosine 3'-phospho 5'-phosphosulfate transporter B2
MLNRLAPEPIPLKEEIDSKDSAVEELEAQEEDTLLPDSETGETMKKMATKTTREIEKGVLDIESGKSVDGQDSTSWKKDLIDFAFAFIGLQVSYLTWGVMQEMIMSHHFTPTKSAPDGRFPSPTFCVFSNRLLAIIVAATICLIKHKSLTGAAPLWYLSPCAFSNTLSSYCQYASLSYVTFPVQNLFKSMKVIPVMLMGKALKGTTYPWIEYMEAIVITMGVILFSYHREGGSHHQSHSDTSDLHATAQAAGILMLCGYLLSDCFTSQWQSKVYQDYGKIDQYLMMFGVNLWSITFTVVALISSGELIGIIDFLLVNPNALYYNVVTAITSTTGQLFIYYTIKRFGPITLTIIMTTRQMFSMIISTIIFAHPMSVTMICGELVVFGAVGHSIYRKYKLRNKK